MRVDWQITVFYVDTNGGIKVGEGRRWFSRDVLTDQRCIDWGVRRIQGAAVGLDPGLADP
jgi:hypothetical protein